MQYSSSCASSHIRASYSRRLFSIESSHLLMMCTLAIEFHRISSFFLTILLASMATADKDSVGPPHFCEPWKFSDVILVVEGEKLHVHRSTLAIWSPVFDIILTSDFKEKNSVEIPLPGKKANEIKLLLQIIYDTSWNRSILTRENCYFLLDPAQEYQIDSIAQMCEKSREKARKSFILVSPRHPQTFSLLPSCLRLQDRDLKE